VTLFPFVLLLNNYKSRYQQFLDRNNHHIQRIKIKFRGEDRADRIHKIYKKNGISPFLPLLIAFLSIHQIPFILGFYYLCIDNIFDFNKSFFWIDNLSNQDILFAFYDLKYKFNLLPIAFFGIIIFLILKMNVVLFKCTLAIIVTILLFFLMYDYPAILYIIWYIYLIFSYFEKLIFSKLCLH